MFRAPLLLTLLATLVATASAQTALPKDSPFAPAAGSPAAALPANETLELGGFSGTDKTMLVCVYDTQAKRSHWIPVGSTVEGIKVVSFDAAKDEATVTVGGQSRVLRLRKSVVATAGTAAAPTASFAAPPPPTPTQGTQQPPPAPGSVAQQETEARMLVSDLLEIGIQQRKAYEEAQKKAEQEKAVKKD